MSILRNGPVALSNLRVKGPVIPPLHTTHMSMDKYDGQENLLSSDPLHMILYPLNLYSLDTVGKNYESLNVENKFEEQMLMVLVLSILQTIGLFINGIIVSQAFNWM